MLVSYCIDTNLGFNNLEDSSRKERLKSEVFWNKAKGCKIRLYEKKEG